MVQNSKSFQNLVNFEGAKIQTNESKNWSLYAPTTMQKEVFNLPTEKFAAATAIYKARIEFAKTAKDTDVANSCKDFSEKMSNELKRLDFEYKMSGECSYKDCTNAKAKLEKLEYLVRKFIAENSAENK